MQPISLEFLRAIISPKVRGIDTQLIKADATPHRLYRVSLRYPPADHGIGAVILKYTRKAWPHDPHASERESRFYRDLLPKTQLRVPRVFFAGPDEASACQLLVLEDLSDRYRFPPPTHLWTRAEAICFLRAYACLHVSGQQLVPAGPQRGWMKTYQRPSWQPDELPRIVAGLHAAGIWPSLPGIEGLITTVIDGLAEWDGQQPTLLHHDVYPPNVALPFDLEQEAILIDWELGGWGWAELDLAYLFLQPYGSASLIDRQALLDSYWDQRARLEGGASHPPGRNRRQLLADGLLALSLIPIASRVAANPFPQGSGPQAYWNAMYPVLFKRLQQLTFELGS